MIRFVIRTVFEAPRICLRFILNSEKAWRKSSWSVGVPFPWQRNEARAKIATHPAEIRSVVLHACLRATTALSAIARDVVELGKVFLGLSYEELKNPALGSFTKKGNRPQEP